MSANRIEALAKALYENGNPQHTAEDRAMLGPFEELDLLQQTIWIDLANAAHNHLTASRTIIPNVDSTQFKSAIRPVCDEQSWIYGMSRGECEYIITRGIEAAAKSAEGE